jgi:hypothetical protein
VQPPAEDRFAAARHTSGNIGMGNRSHRVALPAAALAIIKAVPQRSDRDHLFGENKIAILSEP